MSSTLGIVTFILWTLYVILAMSPCPWSSQVNDLESSCICDYNLAKELSVQCDIVDYGQLTTNIGRHASHINIDLFYVNNSTITIMRNKTLSGLRITNIQFSGCKIKTVEVHAFKEQKDTLRSLNFRDNELTEVPVEALKILHNLTILDLSKNKITSIGNDAFINHKLVTLKLSNNDILLAPGAFRGLEGSLKNLNLMGTKQKKIPEAVRGLKSLAFLDLAQNSIRELPGTSGIKTFEGLDALTGLNLERNLIQKIDSNAFYGVRKTLSSLSLLNNLISEFPAEAINLIQGLRVLDIGFNLISELPENAFIGNPAVTLLAIDGNMLSTIPKKAFIGLNRTLRGLSLGGHSLVCDCKLGWIAEWIRTKDLQVTSRESKPQFCGSPPKFRNRNFYSITPEELTCGETLGETEEITEIVQDLFTPQQQITKRNISLSTSISVTSGKTSDGYVTRTTLSPTEYITESGTTLYQRKPSFILSSTLQKIKSPEKNVIVKEVLRQDNSVIIHWDTESRNIQGFRVMYRLFGDATFKQAPPLEASEREFKIKNVPLQECIVVCVVTLEETNLSPSNIPHNQCKEVRIEQSLTSNMDKITIAASAAICATMIAAILIVLLGHRRRVRKLHNIHNIDQIRQDGPISNLPVNCCTNVEPTPSPGGPIPTLSTPHVYNVQKEWDQVSAYSTRSIPRPRIFPIDYQGSMTRASSRDQTRSIQGGQYSGKVGIRSVSDIQSQRSFSNNSTRYQPNASMISNLLNTKPELRQSRQSLAASSERVPRANLQANHLPLQASYRRIKSQSRSRILEHNMSRPGSRYSLADSTHTLNNYEENNWTDHDVDIYMIRSQTTKNSLVPI